MDYHEIANCILNGLWHLWTRTPYRDDGRCQDAPAQIGSLSQRKVAQVRGIACADCGYLYPIRGATPVRGKERRTRMLPGNEELALS
ncbi:hypothetical protein [Ferrimicrobium sp.]|uniref:hypothetical protein n=1 Tax=Ferrimicrobium sp. TaxID=2926050 RepID=UPI00262DE1D9|nr:hypothetical protein [Ferrimicrobium sp.]